MTRHQVSTIQTPDGKRWYFSHHAKCRLRLYDIAFDEAVELLMKGDVAYAHTGAHVYKVYNKRIEMVINNKLGRIITIYKRS